MTVSLDFGWKRAFHILASFAGAGRRGQGDRRRAAATNLFEALEPRVLLSATNSINAYLNGPDRVAIQWHGQTLPAILDSYVVETKNRAAFGPIAAAGGLQATGIVGLGRGFYMFSNTQLTADQMSAWGAAHGAQIIMVQPNLANFKQASTYPNNFALNNAAGTPPASDYWYLQNTGQTLSGWTDPFSGANVTDPQLGPTTGTANNDIRATQAWDLTTGSPNVVVAVLDTGNDFAQALSTNGGTPNGPQILANLWQNPQASNSVSNGVNGVVGGVYGANFTDGTSAQIVPDNNYQDYVGHGTFVSGEIGAASNTAYTIPVSGNAVYNSAIGLNWNVRVMTVKVLTDPTTDPGGTGGLPLWSGTDAAVIAGIQYVITEKTKDNVNVVAMNMSFGEYIPGTVANNSTSQTQNEAGVLAALQQAVAAGIVPVAAAGNAGLNVDQQAFFPANASNIGVVTVAATDNQGHLATFSNYGIQSVTMAAPGVDIPGISASTNEENTPLGTEILSGTSMSAPLVTGTIALEEAAYEMYHGGQHAPESTLRSALLAGLTPDAALTNVTTFGGVLNAYNAVENIIGTASPYGHVDLLNSNTIAGWAFSPDSGSQPINIFATIDGQTLVNAIANTGRPDLSGDPVVFGTQHGFSVSMPNLAPGFHTVQVYAVDNANNTSALLGQATINGSVPPIGNVDVLTPTTVAGWAYQRVNGTGASAVNINVDGNQVASLTANGNRPDLTSFIGSADHGFSYTLPTLGPGLHRVDVYVVDNQTHQPTLLASRDVSVDPAPVGYVDTHVGPVITGWAYDSAAGTSPIYVRADIDGVAGPTFLANLARPDIVGTVGSPNHGFSFVLPPLSGTQAHTIAVYAIDPTTGLPSMLANFQVYHSTPFGYVDSVSATAISGWAFDPAAQGQSIQVRVDIDGQQGQVFTANIPRPDLAAAPSIGSPNHGFSYNLPTLTAGTHTINVYAYGSVTDVPTLISTQTVATPDFGGGNLKPFGHVDILNGSTVVGWAFDPNAGALPIGVQVVVDGSALPVATANLSRPDLQTTLNSSDHGFSVPLPALSPGSHYVQVFALDNPTNTQVYLGGGYVNSQAPTGVATTLNQSVIAGSISVPGTSSPLVRVDLDGVAGAVTPTGDLGGQNGAFSIPMYPLTPGPHLVQIYAIDPTSLAATLVVQQGIDAYPAPIGHVDQFNTAAIFGWAFDSFAGNNPLQISVTVDGLPDTVQVANIARPDLTSYLGSADHGFDFSLQGVAPAGVHLVTVSVLDPVDSQPLTLISQQLTFT